MLLRLLLGSWRVLQQQLTLEPVYLSLVAALPMVLHRFQRLLQRVHALIDLAGFATGLGQHGEEPRPRPKTSCGLPAGKPLAEQGDTLCHLALLRDGPPPWEQAPGPIRPEAMLRTQCPLCLRLRLSRLGLAAPLMQLGGLEERHRQGKGVRLPPG